MEFWEFTKTSQPKAFVAAFRNRRVWRRGYRPDVAIHVAGSEAAQPEACEAQKLPQLLNLKDCPRHPVAALF